MTATDPALGTPTGLSNSSKVAEALNTALTDCFALLLKTKNLHWHVSDPQLRDYHLLLGQLAAKIIAVTDSIAERVSKIGNPTLRSVGDLARRQRIVANVDGYVTPAAMLPELREDNMRLVQHFRLVKDAAYRAGDNAASGVVDDRTDQAEERACFLFEAGRNSL